MNLFEISLGETIGAVGNVQQADVIDAGAAKQ
jgi:hypothetical protein